MPVPRGTFAEACYDMNTIKDLEDALQGPADHTDCQAWGISPEEWRAQIELALKARIEDDEK
jgi:hypothetical protein